MRIARGRSGDRCFTASCNRQSRTFTVAKACAADGACGFAAATRSAATRWQSLDPHQRRQFKDRYERWKALTPEQRKKVRQRFQQFRKLPKSEQQRILRARKRFQSLSPEQRRQLREKFRNLSPQERERLKRDLRRRRRELNERPGSGDLQQQSRRQKQTAHEQRNANTRKQ